MIALSRVRRRHRPGDSGAALVEAAIVIPILLFLILGIVEYGLAFKNALTVSSASRAGARVAAASPRSPDYAQLTRDATTGTLLNAVPSDGVQYLSIYRADPNSGNPTDGDVETCSTCLRYTWNTATRTWTYVGGTWLYTSQRACGGTSNTDYIGVYVRFRHDFVTGLFGASRTIRERTVMRLEPLPADECA